MNSDGYTSIEKQKKKMKLNNTIQKALPVTGRDAANL